jgi:hypothetical protein
MKVWQIATGEPGRDYRELFFDHDIMILGPSDRGNALENNYADGIPNSAGSQVHSFAHRPEPGDRVLMRFAHDVIGIGQIPQDERYSYVETFKCVYGWDLCHCRRVIWAEQYDLGALASVFQHAKQKPSFTQVHEKHIVEMVCSIDNSYFDRSLNEMPKIDASPYTEETLGVELFRAGISNRNIDDILKALQQAERLCSWYRSGHCGRGPSENEVVSHIILPLFLGLGWSHQQIAIEWNKVDMAFFKNTPTKSENCVMILEAKGLGRALSEVLKQPQGYVSDLGLKNTRYILTTDGANLFIYGKSGDRWDPNPIGYISVLSLQKEYVLPKRTNLVKSLVMLQPSLV